MHPESLANYKLQVYNPGSPDPHPKSDPLRNFSREINSDPGNPLILHTKRKRKTVSLASENPVTPTKKPKMMSPEDVQNLYTKLRNDHKDDIKEIQKENKESMNDLKEYFSRMRKEDETRINTQVNQQLGNIQKQLSSLVDTQSEKSKADKEFKDETNARMKAIEDRFEELEKKQIETPVNKVDIEEVVKSYVGSIPSPEPDLSTWKANLAKDVAEHEHCLIVHGVTLSGNSFEDKRNVIKKFMKDDLKASEDLISRVRIKDVVRLGPVNTASGKPSPILIKFGHPSERNQILPLSSDLKPGICIDKSVPKIYQKKHKEFKRNAWKLKLLHSVQSQVIFEGCNLVLRYKKQDDKVNQYKWVVKEEWHPQPSDLQVSTSTDMDNDTNKQETPIIDTASSAPCNRSIILTGLPPTISQSNAKDELENS